MIFEIDSEMILFQSWYTIIQLAILIGVQSYDSPLIIRLLLSDIEEQFFSSKFYGYID